MKKNITVKYRVADLLGATCEHPDCPAWLSDAVWEAFNNHDHAVTFSAKYWEASLEAIEIGAARRAKREKKQKRKRHEDVTAGLHLVAGGVQ